MILSRVLGTPGVMKNAKPTREELRGAVEMIEEFDRTIDKVAERVPAARMSVYRRLLGLPVRGSVSGRIDRELRKHGLPTEPGR